MLHDTGVDAQSDTCFSVGVPQRRSKKNPDMDKELDLLLGEIEKAWRGDNPTKSLRGLVFKGKEKGIIPESTWHTWRSGVAIPSLLELRRVAKAVGLNVTVAPNSASAHYATSPMHGGQGNNLKPETQRMLKIMERGSDSLRAAIMDLVDGLLTERASNPQSADGDQPGPLARE